MNGGYGPHVWNQGVARRTLIGGRTMNPSPAATSLLGKQRVTRGVAALKRRGKKSAHRGNPLPALVALAAPIIGKYLHLGGPDAAKQQLRLATLQRYAEAGNLKDLDAVALRQEGHGVAINDVTVAAAAELAQKVRAHQVAAAQPGGIGATISSILQSPGAAPVIREVVKQAKPRRQRYPSYRDSYGRQRYSYKPPGTDLRIPRGAIPTPGSPYSFFRGAVGGGSAAATAGQVAVAAGAGIAAYLVTQKLLQYLGGRAQSAEDAGVNAARAHRETLEQLKRQGAGHPTAAEKAEVNQAYFAKLDELGYDPKTFTRTRSWLDRQLETYNPFGG